jgi:hypothetical protein
MREQQATLFLQLTESLFIHRDRVLAQELFAILCASRQEAGKHEFRGPHAPLVRFLLVIAQHGHQARLLIGRELVAGPEVGVEVVGLAALDHGVRVVEIPAETLLAEQLADLLLVTRLRRRVVPQELVVRLAGRIHAVIEDIQVRELLLRQQVDEIGLHLRLERDHLRDVGVLRLDLLAVLRAELRPLRWILQTRGHFLHAGDAGAAGSSRTENHAVL